MPLNVDKITAKVTETDELFIDGQNLGNQELNQYLGKAFIGMAGIQPLNISGTTNQIKIENDDNVEVKSGVFNGNLVLTNLSVEIPSIGSFQHATSGDSAVFNGVIYQDPINLGAPKQMVTAINGSFGNNVYQIFVGNGNNDQSGEAAIQKATSDGILRFSTRGDQDGFQIENNTSNNSLDLFTIEDNSGSQIFNVNSAGRISINTLNLSTSYTPSGTGDSNGNVGDVSWDNTYFYVKTNTGWGRITLDYMF